MSRLDEILKRMQVEEYGTVSRADTNQASEDKQIDDVLTNAIDYYISGNGVQPEAISRVKSLIRTEKLKLLAELEEHSEVMNSDVVPIYGVSMSVIYTLINKLEAEL